MKKLVISFLLGLCLIVPMTVHAIDLGGGLVKKAATNAGYAANTNETSFAELIGTIIKGLLSFVGVIFLVLMVYAGYLWMTARGEEAQIEKAQNIIKSSVIGMVVMVGAYSITSFVVPMILEKTTGDSNNNNNNNEENVLCCTVCPGQGVDCTNSIVAMENDCNEKPDCQVLGSDCKVTPSPASQCSGGIDIVNCCRISAHGIHSAEIMADESGCDALYQNICSQNPQCASGNNVDFDHTYEAGIPASQCK